MAQSKSGKGGEAGDPWSGVRVSRSMLSPFSKAAVGGGGSRNGKLCTSANGGLTGQGSRRKSAFLLPHPPTTASRTRLIESCRRNSAPTVPWSLVWAHGMHRKSPEHGMARLRACQGLRVTWQGPRFSGARNCCGWQVVHRPSARLILRPTASQGIRGIYARIGLCADCGRIPLDPVWGRLGASRCHRRTPRNHHAQHDTGPIPITAADAHLLIGLTASPTHGLHSSTSASRTVIVPIDNPTSFCAESAGPVCRHARRPLWATDQKEVSTGGASDHSSHFPTLRRRQARRVLDNKAG